MSKGRNTIIFTALAIALGLTHAANAQQLQVALQSKLAPTAHFSQPQAGIIPGATVETDDSGLVRRLWGKVRVGGGTAPEAARKFLNAYASPLGLNSQSDLQVERVVTSLTGTHVVYRQMVGGLPVFDGQVSVHLDRGNNVVALSHDYRPVQDKSSVAIPQNKSGALEAAYRVLPGLPDGSHPPTAVAGVIVENGVARIAWKLNVHSISPVGSWNVLVDAATNQVLSYRNILEFDTGTGYVFNPNPVQTSGIPDLVYSKQNFDPRIDNQKIPVTLLGLDSSGFLTGQYADTSPTANRAFSPGHVYQYTYLDHHFSETMAYFHCDAIERYIQSLGFNNIENRQLKVNVDGITDDNSFYDPATLELTLGSGGVPDAQDADVIWHENGHAIQNDQVPDWGVTHEGGAMGEGWGDYWAFTHEAGIGPKSPAWDPFVFKWDATAYNPGNPPFLRILNSTMHYPENMDYTNFDVHLDGEMWSACLWQIWHLIGKKKADTLILESHFYLSPTASFIDGCHAILKANEAMYAGASEDAIRNIFVARGFLPAQGAGKPNPTYTISGTISGTSSTLVSGVNVAAAAPATSPYIAETEPGMVIPAANTAVGATSPLTVPLQAQLTGVSVGVSIQSPNGGRISIRLVGPDGTNIPLKSSNPGDSTTTNIVTTISTSGFNGKQTLGTWKLVVVDPTTGDTDGVLNWWTLKLTFSSGTFKQSAVSRSDGTYFLTQLPAGTYTVTPSKTGTSYAPPTQAITVGPNHSGVNFTQAQTALRSLSASETTMLSGDLASAEVALAPAAQSNTTVQLWSSNPAVRVSSCTVASGAATGSTPLVAAKVTASTPATISARLGSITKTVNVTVLPAPSLSSVAVSSHLVHGGGTIYGAVYLASSTPAPMHVTLTSSDPSLHLPSEVVVQQGWTYGSFTITTTGVQKGTQVTISAIRAGQTVQNSVYVVP